MTRGHATPAPPLPVLRVGDTLLVTLQSELHDGMAGAFQEQLLTQIEKTGAEGLLIDISGLDFVDSFVARVLVETGRMARLMGTETVLVGMRPEVAGTLVRMGFLMQGVTTALNVDEGLVALRSAKRKR